MEERDHDENSEVLGYIVSAVLLFCIFQSAAHSNVRSTNTCCSLALEQLLDRRGVQISMP
jgi:N-acyl-L-homoserine lactone synthetase